MDQPPSHAFSSDEKLTELLNQLVQDFRLGVDPKLDEYCQQYPELEKDLRELFPTLCFIESNKPKTKADSLQSNLEIADSGRIGDYQIIREVGRGGMGIVYEALQISLQRHVALKVMSPLLVASESAVARFRREARAAAISIILILFLSSKLGPKTLSASMPCSSSKVKALIKC